MNHDVKRPHKKNLQTLLFLLHYIQCTCTLFSLIDFITPILRHLATDNVRCPNCAPYAASAVDCFVISSHLSVVGQSTGESQAVSLVHLQASGILSLVSVQCPVGAVTESVSVGSDLHSSF